jgi:hypothetical protein
MWVASSHRLGPDEMKEKGESLETQAFLSSLSLSLSLYLSTSSSHPSLSLSTLPPPSLCLSLLS